MGVMLGAIHGLILWAAKTTFSSVMVPTISYFNTEAYTPAFTQSEIIYNSLVVAGVADLVIVITIISAVWWMPFVEQYIQNTMED